MNLDLRTEINGSRWEGLLAYLDKGWDIQKIRQAYDLCDFVHADQYRMSGEPYINHPVWVAKVVAQLGIGQEAVITSLLHDCTKDGKIGIDRIADDFGDEVAMLVEGLSEVKKKTKDIKIFNASIEEFRKFLFSSVNDVRILIIRLVDKLHNGLTIDALPEDKRINYANRVMGIYGPVADYVGLFYFKRHLEDLAFEILYPKESQKLKKLIKKRSKEEIEAMAIIKSELKEVFKLNRLHDFEIQGRIKSLYSTYLKYKDKGFEKMKDRVGLRIMTNVIKECYTILGLIHASYPYIESEFNDYINKPKLNGYRSIQTSVSWNNRVIVEIQIRTKEMHEFNEFGPASHIAYKMGQQQGRGYEWVKELVKWQVKENNIKNYVINVLEKYVYVFTPNGDTIQLKAGSTALDFAYRLHTYIGDHCTGVKVNKKMAKIDQVLKTGDYVEVLTGNKVNVTRNWLQFVKAKDAREHIKKITNSVVT